MIRYTVKNGDRLNFIERRYYGLITNTLEAANPQLVKRPISAENRPTIYAGDILIIPDSGIGTFSKVPESITAQEPDELKILVNGKELDSLSQRVLRTMDTASDGWSAQMEGPSDLPELQPYQYPDAQVYIGGELKVSGRVYTVAPSMSTSGATLDIQGFSYTADVLDSTMPPPFQEEKVTLEQRAQKILSAFGLGVEFDVNKNQELFERITAEKTDKAGAHLIDLGSQRGYLSSSTEQGAWLYTKARVKEPVCHLELGAPILSSWSSVFDGRKIFSAVRILGDTPGKTSNEETLQNIGVPTVRNMTVKFDNNAELGKQASWLRTKQYAEALTMSLPVSSWLDPNGNIWRENTIVTVRLPEIFIREPFPFLVKRVEFKQEASSKTAILSIVPPSVYTGGEIELPWS